MTTNAQKAQLIVGGVIDRLTTDKSGVPVATRITQALADAGLLMPDMQEPAYEGSTTWYVPGEHEWATDTYKGKVMLEVDIEEADNFGTSTVTKTWFMQRDEARTLAMAILAASNYAEQEQSNE
ncbi:hypothetical protein [uncultured Corynebacterium sp.]|uniref:hypothetical protein n=1 Tax=uncultured Corynebacterium sp. TaxID=159447 RepID=UPI0025DACC57|nr:hypothetical protein [uncultured Corynebacterium sp.]